jgi:RNA polymerase sigma factor (sigma-70 family)
MGKALKSLMALVVAAQAGDHTAWCQVYELVHRWATTYRRGLWFFTRDRDDDMRADAANHVMLQLHRGKFDPSRHDANFMGWAYQVIHNYLVDVVEAQCKRLEVLESELSNAEDTYSIDDQINEDDTPQNCGLHSLPGPDHIGRAVDRIALVQVTEQLPLTKQRDVLAGHVAGDDAETIAARLGMSRQAERRSYYHALEKARAIAAAPRETTTRAAPGVAAPGGIRCRVVPLAA